MTYVDADSGRRNSVGRRNYYADHDKRLRDTIYAGVNGLGTLRSAQPKWAGMVHGVGDRVGHLARSRDSVEEAVYRHPRRGKPSAYHIDKAGLARRYGVPPKTFRAWDDFPPPISDFGSGMGRFPAADLRFWPLCPARRRMVVAIRLVSVGTTSLPSPDDPDGRCRYRA